MPAVSARLTPAKSVLAKKLRMTCSFRFGRLHVGRTMLSRMRAKCAKRLDSGLSSEVGRDRCAAIDVSASGHVTVRRRALARILIVASRLAWDERAMPNAKPFELCIVVDDDEDILLAARMLLRQLFAEVVTTQPPQQALDLMATRTPDAILLDANFARGATDGAEGFRWLGRMLERDPEAVIVLITAHGGVQTAVAAMKHGATDFVSKPWANERLLATVRTAAALRNSRRATTVEKGKVATIAGAQRRDAAARPVARHRARALADRARRADRRQCADPRRERHRQGTGRARTASAVGARAAA